MIFYDFLQDLFLRPTSVFSKGSLSADAPEKNNSKKKSFPDFLSKTCARKEGEEEAAVVNTYGYVGNAFVDFCVVVSENKRGMNRGRSLILLLSLLGVYPNAENSFSACTFQKRSQRAEVIAAIDAKDAAVAAARENRRPKVK